MSIILITHDAALAMNFSDSIMVMYAGKVAEYAPVTDFIKNPLHPYSRRLIDSTIDVEAEEGLIKPIPGAPPNWLDLPSGCTFHPRCNAQDICRE